MKSEFNFFPSVLTQLLKFHDKIISPKKSSLSYPTKPTTTFSSFSMKGCTAVLVTISNHFFIPIENFRVEKKRKYQALKNVFTIPTNLTVIRAECVICIYV